MLSKLVAIVRKSGTRLSDSHTLRCMDIYGDDRKLAFNSEQQLKKGDINNMKKAFILVVLVVLALSAIISTATYLKLKADIETAQAVSVNEPEADTLGRERPEQVPADLSQISVTEDMNSEELSEPEHYTLSPSGREHIIRKAVQNPSKELLVLEDCHTDNAFQLCTLTDYTTDATWKSISINKITEEKSGAYVILEGDLCTYLPIEAYYSIYQIFTYDESTYGIIFIGEECFLGEIYVVYKDGEVILNEYHSEIEADPQGILSICEYFFECSANDLDYAAKLRPNLSIAKPEMIAIDWTKLTAEMDLIAFDCWGNASIIEAGTSFMPKYMFTSNYQIQVVTDDGRTLLLDMIYADTMDDFGFDFFFNTNDGYVISCECIDNFYGYIY